MIGRRPITWLYGWLGLGSQGQQYDVLESVQPVVQVTPWENPPSFGHWSLTVPLVAGTVTTNPPAAGAGNARIWCGLWWTRTNVAAGDILFFNRVANGVAEPIFHSNQVLAANELYPIIGHKAFGVAAGLTYMWNDVGPKVSYLSSVLELRATAAAAVGNISYTGYYVDVPEQSSLPLQVF